MNRVEPTPAATIVLLRDGSDGLEVLVTKRPPHLRFMGGALVFPGGAVDIADRDPRWATASALPPADAARALGEPDEAVALAFYVCALREAFEEVGLPPFTDPTALLDARLQDAGAFRDGCLAAGGRLATDRLVPAGRWVTPAASPRRFDTRFFLAPAPVGWEPVPDHAEVELCAWVKPRGALEELGEGLVSMAPPTIDVLHRLTPLATVDAALAAVVGGSLRGGRGVPRARLSPRVVALLAPNAGAMTGPGTNTYVVGDGPRWVIDPAVDDRSFVDALAAAAADVAGILVTHRHPDHCSGVAALVARTEAPVHALGPAPAGGVDVGALGDGDRLRAPGAHLRVVAAPGHARDHACFLLEEERALFAGDVVMGEGTPVIDPSDGDMRAYLRTIKVLARLDLTRIYPGHFRVRDDPAELLAEILEHRAQREQMVLDALSESGTTLADVVARVYADTPQELRALAARTALAHLELLAADGKVLRDGRLWKASRGYQP